MKIIFRIIRPLILAVLTLSWPAASMLAQEITIPDPSLNAAIHATLGKPAGPLTQQDMLSLTNLNGISRNITSLEGLGAARNLEVPLLTACIACKS